MKSLKLFVLFFYQFLLFTAVVNTNSLWAQSAELPQESDYYKINSIPIPEGIVLEAGGLAFDDKGDLMVTTRRGEVWRISKPGSESPSFERFAQGLHEPLGIAYRNGAWYIAQRGELTLLEDRNNDGMADRFKTIYRWPLSGNYHEYSYGPKFLPNGDMLVTLNLSWIHPAASLSEWRGWMLKITEEGEMTPYAAGMRSPVGFGLNAGGDIFYTDNQGDWVASGWLTHVELGDFLGNPEGLRWSHLPGSSLDLTFDEANNIDDTQRRPLFEFREELPELKAPAVWLPHTIMGVSTSDILLIENDNQVGPFTGQLLVGDMGHSKIMRVFLEKVKGEYQGAVFGFREGFSSGVIKLEWGPDNDIYVAMTSRGWRSTGPDLYGLERLSWNGQIPFEMRSIQAESNGFTIHFTKEVDFETAANIDHYQIADFTYIYHRMYGSPIINREDKTITRVVVSEDRQSVRLFVNELREGYINEVSVEGVQSKDGKGLLHPVGYYTLNNLPEGDHSEMAADRDVVDRSSSGEATGMGKKITEIPAEWTDGPDQTIQLGTEPGLKYDKEEIVVQAGSRVALRFSNDDDMLHNVVIVKPGSADLVGTRAMQLGIAGDELEYVPPMDEVLYHSSMLAPNNTETIYFEAPETPGDYEFVCTFPGHHIYMRGILRVI